MKYQKEISLNEISNKLKKIINFIFIKLHALRLKIYLRKKMRHIKE
jgi:hypothetical protein